MIIRRVRVPPAARWSKDGVYCIGNCGDAWGLLQDIPVLDEKKYQSVEDALAALNKGDILCQSYCSVAAANGKLYLLSPSEIDREQVAAFLERAKSKARQRNPSNFQTGDDELSSSKDDSQREGIIGFFMSIFACVERDTDDPLSPRKAKTPRSARRAKSEASAARGSAQDQEEGWEPPPPIPRASSQPSSTGMSFPLQKSAPDAASTSLGARQSKSPPGSLSAPVAPVSHQSRASSSRASVPTPEMPTRSISSTATGLSGSNSVPGLGLDRAPRPYSPTRSTGSLAISETSLQATSSGYKRNSKPENPSTIVSARDQSLSTTVSARSTSTRPSSPKHSWSARSRQTSARGLSHRSQKPTPRMQPGVFIPEMIVEDMWFDHDDFNMSERDMRLQVLTKVGYTESASVTELPRSDGSVGNNVWHVSSKPDDPGFVVRIVSCNQDQKGRATDTEKFVKVQERCPRIVQELALAFPVRILELRGPVGNRLADLLVMRRASGEQLSRIIKRKYESGDSMELYLILKEFGAFLSTAHRVYCGWHHGTCVPSNVFYDAAANSFTLTDLANFGAEGADDVETFVTALRALSSRYGTSFATNAEKYFNAGLASSAATEE